MQLSENKAYFCTITKSGTTRWDYHILPDAGGQGQKIVETLYRWHQLNPPNQWLPKEYRQ